MKNLMNISRHELNAKRDGFNFPIETCARLVAWFVAAFFKIKDASSESNLKPKSDAKAYRGAHDSASPKSEQTSRLSGASCWGELRALRHRQRFVHHFPQQRSARNASFLATPGTMSLFT